MNSKELWNDQKSTRNYETKNEKTKIRIDRNVAGLSKRTKAAEKNIGETQDKIQEASRK